MGGRRLTSLLAVKGGTPQTFWTDLRLNDKTAYAYLNGTRRPGTDAAAKIASYFDLPLAYVLCTPYPRLDTLGDNYRLVAARASLDIMLDQSQMPEDEKRLLEQLVPSLAAGVSVAAWQAILNDAIRPARQLEIARAASIEAMIKPP